MSIEFQVLDMTCGHCVKTITGAVTAAAPGASVAVDLPTHRVTISGTDQADKVEAAIRDAGYEPQRV
ncbi:MULTISPECIES: heavy-metal-associated domain-containing protein [Achromobacter]|jgi:copper chaperone|uniref:Heavy-metal-associated domain-containing protein n=4 Tax=Achromobacter TaxID=222 RepID=A0A7T4B1E0_9BURK|nr:MULTISPECIES: heavy-metal-associated domain-containing protein [Achromobacter]AMG35469.1 copper chaperone [Achromobacter xylosoxidans]EGP43923.1 heavy-metal-associated domain-containing protein [Achromobacter insuavis AXX-A]MBN9638772.1 heavy-metal-associated domain-containing protein [Achromobacter sp.]MCG2601392.1 heavy-metal-associated domain-containing protein [Achromobacter sp.]QQB33886.1 heavy-metal-associated domain-containing protein [Achromobacter deleyi]